MKPPDPLCLSQRCSALLCPKQSEQVPNNTSNNAPPYHSRCHGQGPSAIINTLPPPGILRNPMPYPSPVIARLPQTEVVGGLAWLCVILRFWHLLATVLMTSAPGNNPFLPTSRSPTAPASICCDFPEELSCAPAVHCHPRAACTLLCYLALLAPTHPDRPTRRPS